MSFQILQAPDHHLQWAVPDRVFVEVEGHFQALPFVAAAVDGEWVVVVDASLQVHHVMLH